MPSPVCKSQLGSGVLSLLVALGISLPLLASLAWSLHQSVQRYIKIEKAEKEEYAFLKLRQALEKSMFHLDSHRFILPPRIHRGGLLNYTNGEANPVSSYTSSRAPSPNSDAITALELEITSSLQIQSCKKQVDLEEIYACARYVSPLKLEGTKGFAGVDVDGLREFQGSIGGSGRCRLLSLKPVTSMSLPTRTNLLPCTVRVLVPILNQYTLYVDKDQRLRYLSHQGKDNIENQPIIGNIKQLSLNLAPFWTDSLYVLNGEVLFPSERIKPFAFNHHLGRLSYFNFLFHS